MKSYEVNFDGLVGPTHNYGGLSFGNVASQSNSQQHSNPKEAALQGLQKMKALMDMGFVQGVLAPQERPDVAALRNLGFSGTDAQVIQQAPFERAQQRFQRPAGSQCLQGQAVVFEHRRVWIFSRQQANQQFVEIEP